MILTSSLAISSYSKLENTINEYLIKNKFRHFETFINILKYSISKVDFGVKSEFNINLDSHQLETILNYKNAILYMNTIFIRDDDVFYIHYTDSVYVTDKDGVIKQDILKYKNNI